MTTRTKKRSNDAENEEKAGVPGMEEGRGKEEEEDEEEALRVL